MPARESAEQVREWLRTEVERLWPLALGCLSLRKSPCVRDHCAACAAGEGHRSHVLYGKLRGRRFSVYVPADLVPEIERAIANGRRFQQLLQEAAKRYAEALKNERGRGRRKRRA